MLSVEKQSLIQDSKLVAVLENLSPLERRHLYQFTISPYFNSDERLTKLLTVLTKAIDNGNTYPNKAVLYSSIYPGRYDDVKMRRAISDLLKLTEDFLAYEKYQADHACRLSDTLHQINTRGLTRHFEVNYSLAKTVQSRSGSKDASHYYNEFLLEAELNQYIELRKERTQEKNISNVLFSLNAFYCITTLRYACAVEHYRNVLHLEQEIDMIGAVLALSLKDNFAAIAPIAVYRHTYYMLREQDGESHYRHLRDLLNSTTDMPLATERDAYVFSINFCVKQINRGKLDYLREVFDLYNIALKKDILFDKNELSPWDYKNLVTLGLRLKEQTWTEKFIKDYKEKLPKANRSNAYTFNLAKFNFYIRRYDDVLKLLQRVEYDDVFYLLDSKTLLIKTYYEMDEYTALHSLISSFRALLRRKRTISDSHRKNYINLLNFINEISRIDIRDKKALEELKKDFEKTTQIADAGWLREKFEELGV
ncbi:MAG: hypothetical protein JST90_00145 [Bacteroidetes bacterium]|nr:hypothetical protein [Bacteroidota bacterium]